MKNTKLSIFTDCLLIFILTFFSSLILLSTLKIKHIFKIVISFIFSFSISLMIFIHKKRKYKKGIASEKERKQFEYLFSSLELQPMEKAQDFIKNLLISNGLTVEIRENLIFANGAVCLIDFSKVTQRREFVEQIKNFHGQNVLFFCHTLSDECQTVLPFFEGKIKIINGEIIFSLLKKQNYALNEEKRTHPNFKQKISAVFSKIFTKKRAFGSAILSAVLLLLSRFSFYPLYYKIYSAILLVLSFFTFIFGKKQSLPKEDPLGFE